MTYFSASAAPDHAAAAGISCETATLPPEFQFCNVAEALTSNGYLPIPIPHGTKAPILTNWRAFRVTQHNKRGFRGHGVGLLTGELVAVDIDVYDREIADEIEAMARQQLGERALVRYGMRPKRVILYRTSVPRKKTSTGVYALSALLSRGSKVEILGDGQHVVCFGIHPDTHRRYEWEQDVSPLDCPLSSLLAVDETAVDTFLAAAEALLAANGTLIKGKKSPRARHASGVSGSAEIPWVVADVPAYAARALEDEAERVAAATEGGRNDALNKAAFAAGTLAQWLDKGTAERVLLAAAAQCGLGSDEARKTFWSGWDAGAAQPRRQASIFFAAAGNDDAHAGDEAECGNDDAAHAGDEAECGDDSDDSGDAECGDDAKAAINARTSAKRAWARGETPAKAVRRIRKNWPDLGADAEEIVRKAYADMQKYAPDQPYFEGLKRKTIVDMNFMNARFGFLNAPGSQSAVVCCADATLVARADFAARLAPKVILSGIGKKGEPVFEPAATFWIESDERRVFREIAFTSRQVPESTFNLWTGFAVKPKAGKCNLINEHIADVVCAGNRVAFAAMMNLIAWQLQNVGKPSKVVPVLISQQQQVGKGVFVEQLLMPILGSAHSYTAKTTKEITGNFNSAALKGKVIVFLDETLFRGDRQAAALIKGLITTQSTPLNEKFLPAVTMPVGLNIWAASNNPNPVHVEECDARYWILDVSEHRYGDYDYFGALADEIENGGREAFLAEMLERDVSNFIPQRDIPRDTAAHARTKVASYAPSDPRNWLLECAEAGGFVGWQSDGQGDVRPDWFDGAVIPAGKMMQAYRHWVTETRGPNIATVTVGDFWAAMRAAGFAKQKKKYGIERVCPNPDACIARIKAGDVVATVGDAD